MNKIDAYEADVLAAFDKGTLKSTGTKDELAQFRVAARSTAVDGDGVAARTRVAVRAANMGKATRTLLDDL